MTRCAEVSAQRIQVVVIQVGGVKTVMSDRSGPLSLELAETMSPEHTRLYGDLITSAVASQTDFLTRALSAEKAGVKIANVASTARPRTRYTLDMDAAWVIPLNRILPTSVMDRVLSPNRRPQSHDPQLRGVGG